MDMFKELMKKKKEGSEMNPKEKDAKMGLLKHIKSMAEGAMGDDIKGIKKVTVASDSAQGLEHGLKKATDIVEEAAKGKEMEDSGKDDNMLDDEAEEGEEASEAPESVEEEKKEMMDEEMSPEEIDEMIKMLQEKKAHLSK